MNKERATYELLCPCGYRYWVSVFDAPEWEVCPVCGLSMVFRLFLVNKEGVDVCECGACQQDIAGRSLL